MEREEPDWAYSAASLARVEGDAERERVEKENGESRECSEYRERKVKEPKERGEKNKEIQLGEVRRARIQP